MYMYSTSLKTTNLLYYMSVSDKDLMPSVCFITLHFTSLYA